MDISGIIRKIVLAESVYSTTLFYQPRKIYSFINPYGYHLMRQNSELFEELDGIYVDGILMCLFCRLFYGHKIKRRSFDNTTVAVDLFKILNDDGRRTIYFVGAKKNEIEYSIMRYKQNFPMMNIIGYRSGYFGSKDEYQAEIENIVKKSPDFVVVGMGAILQESFLVSLKKAGFTGIGFTCGGFIRQSVHDINYFPEWSNRLHLRAFYRLYKEKGTWKRLYNVLIQFPVLFVFDRFSSCIRDKYRIRKVDDK